MIGLHKKGASQNSEQCSHAYKYSVFLPIFHFRYQVKYVLLESDNYG